MKNKVIIAALSLIFIASVACNVYQYNKLNTSRQQLVDAQSQLNNMTNDYDDLDAKLVAMQEQLDALNINMADKQSEIDSLAKENSDLVSSISELEVVLEESKGVSKEVAIAEQTATQATETAQAETTAPTQNFDPDLQAETLQRLAALGFTEGVADTEVAPAGTNDGSTAMKDVGMWE